MKPYHEFLDDAVDEAVVEGLQHYMVIDLLNNLGMVYNGQNASCYIEFDNDTMKNVKETLAKAEGYNNEPFIIIKDFSMKAVPLPQ